MSPEHTAEHNAAGGNWDLSGSLSLTVSNKYYPYFLDSGLYISNGLRFSGSVGHPILHKFNGDSFS